MKCAKCNQPHDYEMGPDEGFCLRCLGEPQLLLQEGENADARSVDHVLNDLAGLLNALNNPPTKRHRA